MSLQFSWTCSYMGCTWYNVYPTDGPKYSIELRRNLGDYERSILNRKTDPEREIVPTIGMIRREYRSDIPISPEVVDAFNVWRDAEHDAFVATLRKKPSKFGEMHPSDHLIQRPIQVGAVHFERRPTEDDPHNFVWVIDVPAPN